MKAHKTSFKQPQNEIRFGPNQTPSKKGYYQGVTQEGRTLAKTK
jgi:hypothetical protein